MSKPWMQAHPKRHDDARLVIQLILVLLVITAASLRPDIAL